ncbi:MAG: transcriptional repressor [Spirochaetes bacterium]|nr:transcriptional repressor [Spirochaetota bacterium]
MKNQRIINIFKTYLAHTGKKITWEREEILTLLLEKQGHFKVEDIVKITESSKNRISRATVYRTFNMLESAGIISHFYDHNHEKSYEINHEHHDHLICAKCGKIIDFTNEDQEKIQKQICSQYHFFPIFHSLHIYGICQNCLTKD